MRAAAPARPPTSRRWHSGTSNSRSTTRPRRSRTGTGWPTLRAGMPAEAMQLDVTFSDQRTNSESEAYGDPTIGENAANTIGKGSMDQWRKR
jgi:hypothetical protein